MFITKLLALLLTATAQQNPWEKIKYPVPTEEPQVYGSHSAGCFTGGATLPTEGKGFTTVNTYRNRFFAHPTLIALIQKWGEWADQQKLGKLVVGDLSQPAGGPLTGAHRSHQTGLDVDLRLHLLAPDRKIKNRNRFNSIDVVRCRTHKNANVNYKFIPQKWPLSSTQLLQRIASEDSVDRIFVSAGIKKYLCDKFPTNPLWLKKIRPEWGHTSHFHVRLQCPQGMSKCHSQPPIPIDPTDTTLVGCKGQDLAKWFQTTPETQILSGCYPRAKPETKPYWQQVLASEKFPKECSEIHDPKNNGTPIADQQTTTSEDS